MNNITTFDLNAREEESSYWLSVFDSLPDTTFTRSDIKAHAFVVSNIKAFARAYHPIDSICCDGVIIN
ncbi:hypothetical protein [Carboxylicivirga sp. M1479]|uniref:hypothetical protein n=1 Tax=Carboxylicivirga sp. M1479 TaxID=2594476 RepID=UPI001178254E|nr:hypothetical protein [Carboxylicivirga sp. M1479]TRX70456.1 hypothetical protein FNN09_10780 [Carboxylicivirga sp. M1479]